MNDQQNMLSHIQQTIVDGAIGFGPKLLVALIILVSGIYVGRWIGRVTDNALNKFHLEPPVQALLVRIVCVLVLALFTIMALQNLGVELLPLIAGLGVASAGIALAMQGVLSNIVAGLTIIFSKPFRVGEYISIVGEEGRVENISLFSTVLSHPDCSQVIIPNRKIVGEVLHNYGNIRQLDILVRVGYETELEAALASVRQVVLDNPLTLCEPLPVVSVSSLAPYSVEIGVKPWVNVPDYVQATGEINQAIIETFRSRGIAIPVPQQDIRLLQGQ
jgi:small conductance mechanosensitive channel